MTLRLELSDDSHGYFVWTVQLSEDVLYRTLPLHPNDLAAALFSIQRDGDRENQAFASASDEEVFFLLEHFFFGGLHNVLEELAAEQAWAKHLVMPSLPTEVSSKMYLVGNRFLYGRNGVFTGSVITSDFDAQLRVCRDRLEAVARA